MTFTFHLVPNWQLAYKWFSMQAAALLTLLLAFQAIQPQFEAFAGFAHITQSGWYHGATALIAAVIPMLRLIHQPVETPAPALPLTI